MGILRNLFLLTAGLGVFGIVFFEVLLVLAMLKKDFRYTTRQCGIYIMISLIILTLSVTVLMGIGNMA